MKKLGISGGENCLVGNYYYQKILEECYRQTGGRRRPEIHCQWIGPCHLAASTATAETHAGESSASNSIDVDPLKDVSRLASSVRNQEAIGMDCLIIPSLLQHYYIPWLQERCAMRILDVRDYLVDECCQVHNLRRVAVLSKTLIPGDTYLVEQLEQAGVEVYPLSLEDQKTLDLLGSVLTDNNFQNVVREGYFTLVKDLIERFEFGEGCGFILGDLELGLAADLSGIDQRWLSPNRKLSYWPLRYDSGSESPIMISAAEVYIHRVSQLCSLPQA